MSVLSLIIGVTLIILGVILIKYHRIFIEKYGKGGLSYKIRVGGIGLLMIGAYLIFQEFKTY